MIASSENSIEALAEIAGQKRDEGEYARAFDVPAVRPGDKTVFDRFPRDVTPEEREAWARQQLTHIRELCANNHGLVFHSYAKYLVNNHAELKFLAHQAMQQFMASMPRNRLSGALQHTARNFAVIYAGAVMAKRAGLLPWGLKATREALQICFLDGVREVERSETTENRAKRVVLAQLDALPPASDVSVVRDVEGWFEDTRKGRIFTVPTTRFREWFLNRGEQRAALRWLHQHQCLKLRDRVRPEWPKLGWADVTVRIAGTRLRCYQFHDPRGLGAAATSDD